MSQPVATSPLHKSIDLEARHYHPAAQAGRFLTLFAGTLALQVIAGAPLAGWADLRSLLAGAAVVAFRQWRKTMPVSAAHRVADEHEPAAVPLPPPEGPAW